MKKIEIIIKGEAGSGKTTLALAFEKFLKENNFTDVEVKDFDIMNDSHNPSFQDYRFDALKDQKIIIETIQIARDFYKKIEKQPYDHNWIVGRDNDGDPF